MAPPPLYNKSYLFCMDSDLGWGNRSYFTFFSVFNRQPSSGQIDTALEVSFLMLFFLLSTLANGMLFYALTSNRVLRTVTNYFICNLTLADMCFTLSCPLVAYVRITGMWTLGSFACKSVVFISFVCAFVTIWTLTLISIDRYTCIVHGFKYRISPPLALLLIGLVWALILAVFCPLAIYFVVKDCPFGYGQVAICTLGWPKTEGVSFVVVFTTVAVVAGFVVPIIILIFSHVNIAIKVHKVTASSLQHVCHRTSAHIVSALGPPDKRLSTRSAKSLMAAPTLSGGTLDLKLRRSRRDMQVVRTLVCLVALFFVMWAPIFTVFVLLALDGVHDTMRVSPPLFLGAMCVAYLNAIVNPLTYGLRTESLRTCLKNVFCKRHFLPASRSTGDHATAPPGGVLAGTTDLS